MADFEPGDIVVLKSGSMRMLVESIDGETVSVLWANDGGIGRETVPVFALNKWEYREPREPRPEGGDRRPAGGAKPYGGDRKGGGKPYGDKGGPKSFGGKDDRGPKPKTGMDGKPRQKTHFRKDD